MCSWRNQFEWSNLSSGSIYVNLKPHYKQTWAQKTSLKKIKETKNNDDVILRSRSWSPKKFSVSVLVSDELVLTTAVVEN